MRQAQVSITMNVYGNALMEAQREAQYRSCQEDTKERTAMKGTLQPHQKLHGVFAGAVIWGYLGLAFRLNGCGGRI